MKVLGDSLHFFKKIIYENKLIVAFIIVYIIGSLSVITWGLPNYNHPFNYYMDEWHQMQSIRELFKHGSPNVPGAANGTIFHWFVSGLFLSPFVLFHIIDPFVVKSAFAALEMQERIFIVLRLNTLLFGILSIVTLVYIAKKYLKINPILPTFFFIFNPIWLYQSNYFKYDIALTFWILLAILFIFRFAQKPTFLNFLFAGAVSALCFATKVSGLVMLPLYLYSFFHFIPKQKRDYKYLLGGLSAFVVIFIVLGIPDLILQKGDISGYLFSNLIESPHVYNNFLLEFHPWWAYLILRVFSLDFGYVFLFLSLIVFITLLIFFVKQYLKKSLNIYKHEVFLFLSLLLFLASFYQLHLGASGNRIIVLLPFLSLLLGIFLKLFVSNIYKKRKVPLLILLTILLMLQTYQAQAVITAKWQPDVRVVSSNWLFANVKKGSEIGIENIPIYQMLPDILLKDYYLKENDPQYKTNFEYQIVDDTSKILPNVVVVTNREFETKYLKKSQKKSLVQRLEKEGYKIIKEYKPPKSLYDTMDNELGFYMSVLVSTPTITIYEKNSQ